MVNCHLLALITVWQGYDRVGLDCCTMLGPLHDDADFFGVTQREVYVTRDGVEVHGG